MCVVPTGLGQTEKTDADPDVNSEAEAEHSNREAEETRRVTQKSDQRQIVRQEIEMKQAHETEM